MKGAVNPCSPKYIVDLFQHGPTRLNQNLQPFNQGTSILDIEMFAAYNVSLHLQPPNNRCLDTTP